MTLAGPTIQIEITWEGPFAWPGFEESSSPAALPNKPGVYIQAFEYLDGYLVAGAGITNRPVAMRLREHTRRFLNGEYTVLDVGAANQAERKEVWHGWGYARAHRHEFEARRKEIQDAARLQLASYRIFVADPEIVAGGMRLRERLEAGIMDSLYQHASPICDLPDRGMFLSRRRATESPVLIRSVCSSVLYGLSEVVLV